MHHPFCIPNFFRRRCPHLERTFRKSDIPLSVQPTFVRPRGINQQPAESIVMPSTIRLHRVLTTKPEKVYRAFLEADALAKWLPPNGFPFTVHHLEPKVG